MESQNPTYKIRVSLIESKVESNHVVYLFEVKGIQTNKFIIRDRYSNIRKMYKKLKKKVPGMKKRLGIVFPGKNNFVEDFLKNREELLEDFFRKVIKDE